MFSPRVVGGTKCHLEINIHSGFFKHQLLCLPARGMLEGGGGLLEEEVGGGGTYIGGKLGRTYLGVELVGGRLGRREL